MTAPSPALVDLLAQQDGVVSRSQALATGLAPHDLERLVRRREWARVHPGVFVCHTGPLRWRQRAWAAVLLCGRAALCGSSAVKLAEDPETDDHAPVHVAVARDRSCPVVPGGVVVRRVAQLETQVRWSTSPPSQRYEEAVIDLAASARRDVDAVSLLTTACGSRRTTADRLLRTLAARRRVPRRAWLRSVLHDAQLGTTSVLEHGYLVRVERAHRLPRAQWQQRVGVAGSHRYRDATYGGLAVVELDGRTFHRSYAQREDDLTRDLDLAASGGATVRLGWRQVYDDPCRTAVGVVAFLRARGVVVAPDPCRPGCPVR